jgi:hypothetical protein
LIYVETSVVLAHLLAEEKTPPPELWRERLVSSRLLVYESWNRVHRLRLGTSHGPLLERTLDGIALLELRDDVLARAKEPFPLAVRTLDAIHLSALTYMTERGIRVQLATYDARLLAAAKALDLPIAEL